jgi:hypothetical protein
MRLSSEADRAIVEFLESSARMREDRKTYALILKLAAGMYDCPGGAVYAYKRASGTLHKLKSLGASDRWDPDTLAAFYENRRPRLESNVIMAPLRVGRQVSGVLALSRESGFPPGAGKELSRMLRVMGTVLGARRGRAVASAETAVARAMAKGLNHRDLLYRILHSLRRFIDYNHGATVLRQGPPGGSVIIARQVAWSAMKSDLVGSAVDLGPIRSGPRVRILNSLREAGEAGRVLISLSEKGAPPPASCVVAGLFPGFLVIASDREGFFAGEDVEIIGDFAPYVTRCIYELSERE